MKVTLTFKTPDVVSRAIEDAVDGERERFLVTHDVETVDDLSEDAVEELDDKLWKLKEDLALVCGRWVKFGEQIQLEVDTEEETIFAIPAGL